MPNKVNKVQKKKILQALYEDNAKLQRFQLGKVELQEQEQGQEVATRQGNVDWLNLIMFLVLVGGVWGVLSYSSAFSPGSATEKHTSVAVNVAPTIVAAEESKDALFYPEKEVLAQNTHIPDVETTLQQEKGASQHKNPWGVHSFSTMPVNWSRVFLEKVADEKPFYQYEIVVAARKPVLSEIILQYVDMTVPESPLPETLLGLVDTQLPLARLFSLQVHTIVIDPGHGGRDPGTIGRQTGLMEKEITLDIARMVKAKLEKNSRFNVLLTRDSDRSVSLKERTEFARENQADLFISIHVNSLPNESDNLVETFFFGAYQDVRDARLAEKENKGSDFTLGDFTEMIRVLGDTLKTQESQQLAQFVQSTLFFNMNKENEKLANAGIKTAPFVVLLGVEIPAILTEIACISNNQEEVNLSESSYRRRIADYLDLGIRGYLEHRASDSIIAQGVTQHGSYQ